MMSHLISNLYQVEHEPEKCKQFLKFKINLKNLNSLLNSIYFLVIKELVKPDITIKDLQYARKAIQQKADETNTQLKKNVYQNYTLFIDTAKEINLLKNEMYTLSNLLSDEQKLLSSLLDISISGDKGESTSCFQILVR